MPEMAVGIYDWAVIVDHLERAAGLVGQGREPETDWKWDRLVAAIQHSRANARGCVSHHRAAGIQSAHEAYAAAFRARVHDYIHAGDCYQINLAQRFAAPAVGDPWLAYQALRIINPAPYSAF